MEYHNEVASYYDEDAMLGFEARAEENIVLSRIRSDFRHITEKYEFTKALEIGCGPGFDIEWFAVKYPGREFTAIDISGSMTALAEKRVKELPNTKVLQLNETQLVNTFGTEAFDLVYVYFGALNTAKNLADAAVQIREVLKPGAIAVLTFVNKYYLREMMVQLVKLNIKAAFSRIRKVWGGYSPGRFLPSHCYSPKTIKRAFKDMELIEKRGYSIFYPAWYNHHKVKRNPVKAEKQWNADTSIQSGFLWSKGEYTLFVLRKPPGRF